MLVALPNSPLNCVSSCQFPAAVPFKASAQRRSVVSRAGKDNDGGRQPWDLGRFARTLWFFNGPNGSLTDILGGLFKPKPAPTTPEPGSTPSAVIPLPGSRQATPKMMANSADGIVLVAGATGGVGKRVVEQLLARGRRVRALVRDVPKATELLVRCLCALHNLQALQFPMPFDASPIAVACHMQHFCTYV